VTAITFTVRDPPGQRLDLSALTPSRLKGLSLKDIATLPLATTREAAQAGEVFRITRDGRQAAGEVRLIGTDGRFDRIGEGLAGGSVLVEGDAGAQAGRAMRAGELAISGQAGPWAGSGMSGGRLTIGGDAGDWLGGPLPGEMAGMRGGLLRVRGDAGEMAGDRMRRGIVLVDGDTGTYPGSRMIAGTFIVGGAAGALPGYLMRRGTICLRRMPARPSPTFVPSGPADPVFRQLLARLLADAGAPAAWIARGAAIRLAGDTAVLGKGEIFVSP
jgi:formylmethanofuran dehydrogenase subunit C